MGVISQVLKAIKEGKYDVYIRDDTIEFNSDSLYFYLQLKLYEDYFSETYGGNEYGDLFSYTYFVPKNRITDYRTRVYLPIHNINRDYHCLNSLLPDCFSISQLVYGIVFKLNNDYAYHTLDSIKKSKLHITRCDNKCVESVLVHVCNNPYLTVSIGNRFSYAYYLDDLQIDFKKPRSTIMGAINIAKLDL
ncbi:hypothetical protein AFV9_gp68 [Betalipothrixvirus uzonense]|uniref:Uncharacterized protein n=1 Tax=Betalipothrixvirus uzonense TaxID=512792 RepID=B2CRP5_9VIRU|nr:hypothetical protein AFV9_gp68 [Acidianus filamentous virus 9]ACB37302.1 hypothetical protein [Acidianus filamentous virus 9]